MMCTEKKKVAVVFDSAGTLLHMYRVARDMESGEVLKGIASTSLVAEKKGRALLVLHIDPGLVMGGDVDVRIVDFLEMHGLSIDISCASSPFTVEEAYGILEDSKASIADLQEVLCYVKSRCPNIFYIAVGVIVDRDSHSVVYSVSTGGRLYHDTTEAIRELKKRGVDTYIASGDSIRNLESLVRCIDIPIEGVFDIATTRDKENIVKELKGVYDVVLMVGDGMNDILALRAADIGVVTLQQGDKRPQKLYDAADIVINDIIEVIGIVDNL